MVKFNYSIFHKFTCSILFLVVILIDACFCYTRLSVEDPTLCSINKKQFKLGTVMKSGLIVFTSRLNDHKIDWEYPFQCTFEIIVRRQSDGVFAVIQDMVFRRDESTGDCIDYITFVSQRGTPSRKYCGELHATQNMNALYVTDQISSSNAFIDNTGHLDVTIFVDKRALRPDEQTNFNLSFTSYRHCVHSVETDKPCGDAYKNECISQVLFHDGIVNCPYPDCVDEGGCHIQKVSTDIRKSVGNTVIIGSVSSLLMIFIIFICCLWICRKYRKLCWSDEFSNPTSPLQQPSLARNMEMNDQPLARASNLRTAGDGVPSSAPALNPEREDKDLPPSYESLFPDK